MDALVGFLLEDLTQVFVSVSGLVSTTEQLQLVPNWYIHDKVCSLIRICNLFFVPIFSVFYFFLVYYRLFLIVFLASPFTNKWICAVS